MQSIDDSEWDEGDLGSEIEGKDVVDVSSKSDEGGRGAKAKHAGLKKTVVKAFRANPLLEPSAQQPRTTAASDALSSLTSVFNPAAIKDRDESRLSSLVQFNQINTLQAKLCKVRQHIESLNDRLMQECRRADRAESQVEMLKYMLSSRNETVTRTPARSHDANFRQASHTITALPHEAVDVLTTLHHTTLCHTTHLIVHHHSSTPLCLGPPVSMIMDSNHLHSQLTLLLGIREM